MIEIRVADVGDGLCCTLGTLEGIDIQIDCGSQQGPERAIEGLLPYRPNPSVFILSHFHTDHYNGLFSPILQRGSGSGRRWDLEELYYPRMPSFPRAEEFLWALRAVECRCFGDESGSMELDFIETIKRISRTPFRNRAVCQGDKIQIRGSTLDVRWPPRFADAQITQGVESALEEFHKVLREDDQLHKNFDQAQESSTHWPYTAEGSEVFEREEPHDRPHERDGELYCRREVSERIRAVNRSLRDVANRLSLAFNVDNRFLFMGDAKANEINAIVSELMKEDRDRFMVFLTPHHGTHWGKELRDLKCIHSLSSNGPKMSLHFEDKHKGISRFCACTFFNGGLSVPMAHPHAFREPW